MERQLRVGITGAGGNLGMTLVNGLRSRFDLKLFLISNELQPPSESSAASAAHTALLPPAGAEAVS